jgi:prephenate dehydratase
MDFLGHRTQENVKNAIAESKKHCLQLSVLGSFPRATELL